MGIILITALLIYTYIMCLKNVYRSSYLAQILRNHGIESEFGDRVPTIREMFED